MVSGTRDNPTPRDNFTERLYDKKLSRLTEIKLTILGTQKVVPVGETKRLYEKMLSRLPGLPYLRR